jgi:hypothetical protein
VEAAWGWVAGDEAAGAVYRRLVANITRSLDYHRLTTGLIVPQQQFFLSSVGIAG